MFEIVKVVVVEVNVTPVQKVSFSLVPSSPRDEEHGLIVIVCNDGLELVTIVQITYRPVRYILVIFVGVIPYSSFNIE